jgi:hypothetical protein
MSLVLESPVYFSGQGRVLVAPRLPSGRPGAFRFLCDCPGAKFDQSTDVEKIKESVTGQRLTAKRLYKGKELNVTIQCKQLSRANLSMGFYSAPQDIAAGTVTGEVAPLDLVADDEVGLDFGAVSDLVITDSAVGPATLVEGTDYQITSAGHGTYKILDPTGFTQPFKQAYSYGDQLQYPLFTGLPPERYLRIEGLNTAEDDQPVLIEVYRFASDPFASIDWINDASASFELKGEAEYDALNGADPTLGYFGRVKFLGG